MGASVYKCMPVQSNSTIHFSLLIKKAEESALCASHDVHTAWRHMKTANGTSHPSFLSLIISCLLLSYILGQVLWHTGVTS